MHLSPLPAVCFSIILFAAAGLLAPRATAQRSGSTGSASGEAGDSARTVDDQDRPLAEDRKSSEARLAKGDINFDDLQFDIEKDEAFDQEKLNDRVKSLKGKTVKLRGYILPSTLFRMSNIDQFVLVRDNQECCFGPRAALYDCVMVKMVGGNTTDFVTRPVTVEGTFKIDTESYRYPGGRGPGGASHLAIFQIDGVQVK